MRIRALRKFVCALLSLAAPAQAENTLCSTGEQVLFSCAIKNSDKRASVCGSEILSNTLGYLQYRFGTSERLEIIYPKSRWRTQEAFYLHAEPRVGIHELLFKVGQYSYAVGHYVSAELSEEPQGTNKGDIVVNTKKRTVVRLECADAPQGYMGALDSVVRSSNEFNGW